jgi:hypothetical protein
MNEAREFQEIAHCGGQVIFNVSTDGNGRRRYQVTWQSSRPVPMAVYSIYALPQGIPVADLPMGGIGSPWPDPPVPGLYPLTARESLGFNVRVAGNIGARVVCRSVLIVGYTATATIFYPPHSVVMFSSIVRSSTKRFLQPKMGLT